MTRPVMPETPAVLIDRGILDRNIAALAEHAAARGLRLRPHAKTHKLPQIAHAQLARGATGLSVATIGEAEVFAAAGCDDLFVAYPVWPTPEKAARVAALLEQGVRLRIGVDSAEAATAWAGHGLTGLALMIELDSGHHRSGTRVEDSVNVARAVASAGHHLAGLFTFPGHSYTPGGAGDAARGERDCLVAARDLLSEAGFDTAALELSGGSTPSATLTEPGGVTEIRPGVYVFNDAQQLELGRCGWEDIALTVAATVVSRRVDLGQVVLDAGSKVLGSDRPAWASGFARVLGVADAQVTTLSEHHATVAWPTGLALPRLGEQLKVVPNHVCPVLNLVDEVTALGAGGDVEHWRVAARGKNN